MTECERILSKGILDKDFLKEETRCDYHINTTMKKVWVIYLDLLLTILDITRRNGLRCWIAYGSLIGTIRHKGFIPWDDDLDVWMPRPDYELFIEIAQRELTNPYFIQTTLNDVDYYSYFARLRNSNTTGILVSHHNKCNNGIFLDIFPLDGEEDNYEKYKRRQTWININHTIAHAYTFNINPHPLTRMTHRILRLPFIPYSKERTYIYTQKLAKEYTWFESEFVGSMTQTPANENRFKKEWFDETIEMPFETISVPVPAGYDALLTSIYGDYMKFPSIEDRGKHHSFIFEPDIPYQKYMTDTGLLKA